MAIPSPKRSAPLMVEQLEDRCLLSGVTNPAVVPTPNTYPVGAIREAEILATPPVNAAVVFLGDSITDYYANQAGAAVWKATMAPLPAEDFAIAGNRTENVLWQIDSGQLNAFNPRVVALMIGTNNLTLGETPDEVAAGVAACVTAIQTQLPSAKVLLLGILPRGASPADPIRAEVTQTNALISSLANGTNVWYLDCGPAFLQADGSLSSALMPDGLHPSALGYLFLTAELQQPLQALLNAPATHPGGKTTPPRSGGGIATPALAAEVAVSSALAGETPALDAGLLAGLLFTETGRAAAPSSLTSLLARAPLATASTGMGTLTPSGTDGSTPLAANRKTDPEAVQLAMNSGDPGTSSDDGNAASPADDAWYWWVDSQAADE